LFVERGYSAVSMNDIAAAAGLTKGALYGHFRSKGQLLVEVIRWKIADHDHAAGFAEAIDDPERAVTLFFDDEGRDVRLLEVDAAAAARHDPDVAAGLGDLYDERLGHIRDVTAETRDPYAAAWLITALSAGIGMKEASRLPLPDADRLGAAILGALQGLE
jgi:AcrR family transcriptional regulator